MSKPVKKSGYSGPHAGAWKKLQGICGGPALLPGEDRAAYEELWVGVAEALTPRDFLEYLDVQNLANSMWDEWRRRRCTAGTMKAAVPSAIRKLLATAIDGREADAIAQRYADGTPQCKKAVEAQLAEMGFTPDDVRGVAFEIRIHDIETLERLGAKGDWRRGAIRREMDRRRDALARRSSDHRHEAPGAQRGDGKAGVEA